MKINLKLLMAFGIMLLGVITLNCNTINAAVANENSLNNVPDTIEVGIPTTEAIEDGYMSEKLHNIICQKVESHITDDITNMKVIASFNYEKLLSISKVDVSIYTDDIDFTLIAEKTINVKYTDNWNENDSEYIRKKCADIDLSLPNLTIELGETKSIEEIVEEGFNNVIGDSSIQCTFYASMGMDAYPEVYAQGIVVFGKDNVIYYSVSTESICPIPTITIPESVEDTEDAYMEYAISKLKELEHLANEDLKMEKEAGENEYSLYIGSPDPVLMVLKKDVSKKEVVSTDKETNIKLETTGAVVPVNTVLEVKPIETGIVYDTVCKVITEAKKIKAFDITLKSEGVKIQPNGNVRISIPIPEDMGKEGLCVIRVSDNGEKTKYDVKVEEKDGIKYATFETNHFSTYVLAELKVEDNKNNNNSTVNNNNADNNEQKDTNKDKLDVSPVTGEVKMENIISLIAMLSIAGIVVLKKK